ncbi:MAG: HNH endonuclease [Nitrospirota bacterium]|nr:HNH endonuclease [Nitrospirota bacterium]
MNAQEEKPSSRNIPEPIKREVRRRCGFGCVICGMPLYEYDHMEGWAQVRRHDAEKITLLCDQHHKERTNELLPIEDVMSANTTPFNLRQGVSTPYDLHFSGRTPEVHIGSNVFTASLGPDRPNLFPIIVDQNVLVGFSWLEEHLYLRLLFFDEYNNQLLSVLDNQLLYSVEQWDIQLIGKKLIIRHAPRHIFLEIEFHPPGRLVIIKGRMLCNGVEILISPENVKINNYTLAHSSSHNAFIGIGIGTNLVPGTAFAYRQVSRYLPNRST